jgi:hypothetical protein
MGYGRPTKLTGDRQEKICEALRKGVTIKGACDLVGLDESTYYKWRNRGEDELRRVEEGHANCRVRKSEKRYVDFFEATTRAIAESERALVENIEGAAEEDWRAALELLRRRFSDRWSKQTNVDVTSDGEPITDINLNVIHTDVDSFEQERREALPEHTGDGAVPEIKDGETDE